jgi:hypothetical protein
MLLVGMAVATDARAKLRALICAQIPVRRPALSGAKPGVGAPLPLPPVSTGIPLRPKVAALEHPLATAPEHTDIVVGRRVGRLRELDFEIVVGCILRTDKARVPVILGAQERIVRRRP